MILFYIRHGEATYDPDALTPQGRRQAESLARRFGRFGLDRVYCAPARRAVETARPTCEILGLEQVTLDWLGESLAWGEMSVPRPDGSRCLCSDDPGILRSLLGDEVRALGDRWHEHPAFARFRFGEGVARMRRESDGWLATLGYVYDVRLHLYRVEKPACERIAVFGHEVAGLLFLSIILDIPFPFLAAHFQFGHTGLTAIEFKDLDGLCVPRVLQLSSDGHLYRDDLPLNYCARPPF